MTAYDSIPSRRFYRSRDEAIIGGVCAGVAEYFGFNRRVTRLLTFIAFLFAPVMTLLFYFGTVLLIPTEPREKRRERYDAKFRRALRAEPNRTMTEVRRRFRLMESRLARLEKHVTSPRYNLDEELRRL